MKTSKNNLKKLLSLILVGFPLLSFASGDINIVKEKDSGELKRIKIEIPELFDLDVTIYDEKGQTIYFNSFEKNSKSSQIFNFSQLENGEYTIISKGGFQTITKTLLVKDNNFEVLEKSVEISPLFELKNNLLTVNYLNKNKNDIIINIENNSNVIYSEKINGKLDFNKAIDVSNLSRGSYYISLNVNNKIHGYSFNIL